LVFRLAIFLTILSVFVLDASPVFAAGGQFGSLRGNVYDSVSKAPVAGAAVQAVSASGRYTTVTDAHGNYSIIGMVVDTYTLTITASGYLPLALAGQTLTGDQILNVGSYPMTKASLKTIARVSARALGGAFQAQQTIDSYTVRGPQIQQTTGNAFSTNENALLLAVPGVTLDNAGNPTIRGGAAYEVGYQYDGVTFKEPFLGNNGSFGTNGNLFNGVSDVQVVGGAGDATQGGVGSGVINVIPARGSYPWHLDLDVEAGGPNFFHQFAGAYSWATEDGRFSDYMALNAQNYVPYFGYHLTPQAQYLNYFVNQYSQNRQFTNNFIFKFGHNQNQSLQVLYTNILQIGWGPTPIPGTYCDPTINAIDNSIYKNYLPATCPAGSSPSASVYYPYDTLTRANPLNGLPWALLGFPTFSSFSHLVGLLPNTPAVNIPPTGAQQNENDQTRFLKFEYDYHIDPATYLQLKYYNWEELTTNDNSFTSAAAGNGINLASWSQVGGPTVGGQIDLTHQFTPDLTFSVNAKEDVLHPIWDGYLPEFTILAPLIASLNKAPAVADYLAGGYLCQPSNIALFPSNLNANCSAGYLNIRMPSWGIGYNKAFFQNWGYGFRTQFSPGKLKLDLGVRQEGQNQHWFNQLDQYGMALPPNVNPFDVPSSSWTTKVLYPQVLQPRTSAAWELGLNDSIRFSYGRSAVFANAQTAGTPFHLYGIQPYLGIPAVKGGQCGWTSGQVVVPAGQPGCTSYAQQLYWSNDNVEAPDAGNGVPATYNNFDFSYSHRFRSGFEMRITPFEKIGTNLPTFFLINPTLGIFGVSNQGYNKTNGAEFYLTSPYRQIGLSGFFSATYQNVLSTTPPLTTAETTVPLVPTATLALGNLYRAGYVSPMTFRIGASQNFADGFSVIPQFEWNVGYPYSFGGLIAAQIAPGVYANIPQVNFGPGVSGGLSSILGTAPGTSISTQFVDPADPGTALHPNIDATRGTPQTSATGGFLSHSNFTSNVTLQWKHANQTFGVQLNNVFGNAFVNSVPSVNPFYQAVANGVSGPQTGFNSCFKQVLGQLRGCTPFIPRDSYAFSNGAYLLTNGNFSGAAPLLAPLTPFTFNAFYQVRL
jgi:hypothetical protein